MSETFEERWESFKDRGIEEMGILPDVYDEFQLKNSCEHFHDLQEKKITQLEKQNEELKGDVERWKEQHRTSGGCWVDTAEDRFKELETKDKAIAIMHEALGRFKADLCTCYLVNDLQLSGKCETCNDYEKALTEVESRDNGK